jgi:hypothetical protein
MSFSGSLQLPEAVTFSGAGPDVGLTVNVGQVGGALGLTTTCCETMVGAPAASSALRVTVNVPPVVYVCWTEKLANADDGIGVWFPSAQSRVSEVIVLVESAHPPIAVTSKGAVPLPNESSKLQSGPLCA